MLLYDLETSPFIGFSWAKWETDIIEFIAEKRIISFAWKWLGEKKTHVLAMPDFPGYKPGLDSFMGSPKNNRALVVALHNLFGQADVTVGHNVIEFDDKTSNSDFLVHGLKPPPPHRTVDTLKVARSKFKFASNKLDDLGARLELGRKVKHPGFALWKGCLHGDKKAWDLMKKYNAGDVDLLEKVYHKLRPWMTSHPNMLDQARAELACPSCKGKKLKQSGVRLMVGGTRPRYQCLDCGKWSTGHVVKRGLRIR